MAGSPQSPQQAAAQSYMSGLSAIPGSPIGAAAIAQSGRFPVAPIEYAQGLLESPDFYAPMLSRAAAALGQAGYLSTPANQSTAQAQALQKLIDDATTANDKLNAKAVTAQKAADTGAAKADKATLSGNFADAFDGANLAHVASKSGLQPEQVVNVMLNPDNPAGAAQAQKNYDDFKAAIADKSKNLTTPKAVETWLGQNITDPIIRRILGAMDMRAKG
jgi:hypothetical protein